MIYPPSFTTKLRCPNNYPYLIFSYPLLAKEGQGVVPSLKKNLVTGKNDVILSAAKNLTRLVDPSPSLDMLCELLGISGIPLARNRERVGVRTNQYNLRNHPQRKLVVPFFLNAM